MWRPRAHREAARSGPDLRPSCSEQLLGPILGTAAQKWEWGSRASLRREPRVLGSDSTMQPRLQVRRDGAGNAGIHSLPSTPASTGGSPGAPCSPLPQPLPAAPVLVPHQHRTTLPASASRLQHYVLAEPSLTLPCLSRPLSPRAHAACLDLWCLVAPAPHTHPSWPLECELHRVHRSKSSAGPLRGICLPPTIQYILKNK